MPDGYISDLLTAHKPLENLGNSASGLAESWARQSATRQEGEHRTDDAQNVLLGGPLSIRQVALMLGCSPWTVRQTHIPDGLPHFRSGPNGKLIFFRNQVTAWILTQQKKGGTR
jgi:hypothetical protein